MKNYNIVIKDYYAKEMLIDYLRKNYITFNSSEYYDRGYYIGVYCTPETVTEIDNFLDSNVWNIYA